MGWTGGWGEAAPGLPGAPAPGPELPGQGLQAAPTVPPSHLAILTPLGLPRGDVGPGAPRPCRRARSSCVFSVLCVLLFRQLGSPALPVCPLGFSLVSKADSLGSDQRVSEDI